jgi:hypothetical protein
MKHRLVHTFSLLAALGVAACGDDGPVATGDQLSETEIQALSSLILSSGFESTTSLPAVAAAVADGPQAAPFTYTGTVDATTPCSLGGSVHISGTAMVDGDDETLEYRVTYDVDQAHDGCVELAETGQQFDLTSSLAMDVLADIAGAAGSESLYLEGEVLGTVNWKSEGREGGCPVTLNYEAQLTTGTISVTASGEVCESSFSHNFEGTQG